MGPTRRRPLTLFNADLNPTLHLVRRILLEAIHPLHSEAQFSLQGASCSRQGNIGLVRWQGPQYSVTGVRRDTEPIVFIAEVMEPVVASQSRVVARRWPVSGVNQEMHPFIVSQTHRGQSEGRSKPGENRQADN